MTDLRERIATALGGGMVGAALAEGVIDAIGLEQVGWFITDPHRHDYPRSPCHVSGEFRFTEEEDGCPAHGQPVYLVRPEACDVCNGTGLTYDSAECRMVPCGGICCTVKS